MSDQPQTIYGYISKGRMRGERSTRREDCNRPCAEHVLKPSTDTRLADAEAMAEAAERFRLFLQDHPSPAVTYLVTSAGNDAWADFCAALAKWKAGEA